MKFDLKEGISTDEPADVYVVPSFEDETIQENFPTPNISDFKGKSGDLLWFFKEKPTRILFVGLGKLKELTANSLRKNIGSAAYNIREKEFQNVIFAFPKSLHLDVKIFTEVVVEAFLLGSYRFEKYLTDTERLKAKINNVTLFIGSHSRVDLENRINYASIVAESTNFTRDLANTPHRDMNAILMANEAKKMANEVNLKIDILGREEAEKEGMNLFLSVNNGSKNDVPGRFVVLEYSPPEKAQKTVVFVGKGITFDTGGISLKPGQDMDQMIYDMCGAGAVLGALRAVALLKPKNIKIIGITPLTDNAPSGSATKPGDIVKSKNGKTVEIINTDAEGRLVLADALTFAERFNPDFVIDLATLTGACVIALGAIRAAAYFNEKVDPNVRDLLLKSGEFTGDLLWHMPMNKEYFEQIKSKHADIKNVGGRPAGSITAAIFLSQFAEKYPWSHLDIAGTAWGEKVGGYLPGGASGFGVRVLVNFIREFNAR